MEVLVFAIMAATWASFGVSLVAHSLIIWPFWLVLLACCFAIRPKPEKHWLFWVTILGWGAFLVKLFSQMMMTIDGAIWAGGSNVWGDWAGHIGYIANWLYGNNWPPQNPWYAGVRLSYPFLFDFTSAILAKSGLSVAWSLQIPGMVLGIILVVLIYRLTVRLTKNHAAAAIAIAIFMLSGGLGFILIPHNVELTHSYEANIQWVNFIISEMVPQRGILIGLCAFLVMSLWLLDKKYWAAGLIAGMIPFFHAHTYMVAIAVTGFWFLLKPQKDWFKFFIPAILLAAPQFYYFSSQVLGYSSGFFHFQLGWAAHVQHDNWLWFWFKNIGVMLPLIPVAWWWSWKKYRKLFWLYFPFLLVFVGCNLFIFQPWENDNSKLLRFWYLATSILVAWFLAEMAAKNWFSKIIVIALIVLATLSGAVDAGNWLNFDKNKLQMWSREDIALAEMIKTSTSPTAVFLTNDNHNHWVVDLAGRKIAMGFRGWLWSWGINYASRESDINRIFVGDPQTPQLLAKYNIDYVIVGPGEISNFHADQKYFEDHYPLLVNRYGQEVFDVRAH